MITYKTMINYGACARSLDDRRLGLCREQTLAILDSLTGLESEVPEDHPVLRMWWGYEYALCLYGMFLCFEWTKRGFEDTIFWKFDEAVKEIGGSYEVPLWNRDEDVCRSHRSNLMRRWPGIYRETWAGTPENMPYLWPANLFEVDLPDINPSDYELRVSKHDKLLLKSGERKLPKRIKERVVNL